MIGLVDYASGNIASVSNALKAIGVQYIVSSEPSELGRCSGIILPGVGAAPGAMAALRRSGLDSYLTSCEVPLLGICLGMQILYRSSEEGNTTCLGLLPGVVKKFDRANQKVPHMGWNECSLLKNHRLMDGIRVNEFFYFAHSYYVESDELPVSVAKHGNVFPAVVARGNLYGTQFHPEKSGSAGLTLLRNFDALCR